MRRRYLIDKETQSKITAGLFLFTVLVGGVLGLDMYVIGLMNIRSEVPALLQDSTLEAVRIMFTEEWYIFLPLYAFNLAFVYYTLIYYTHRIAGPVHKCVRVLNAVAEGDLDHHVVLRKHDYFKPLATTINNVVERHGTTIGELRAVTARLRDKLEARQDQTLQDELHALENVLARYRVRIPIDDEDTQD